MPSVTILQVGPEFREQRGACFGLCIRKLVCHIKAEYPILRERNTFLLSAAHKAELNRYRCHTCTRAEASKLSKGPGLEFLCKVLDCLYHHVIPTQSQFTLCRIPSQHDKTRPDTYDYGFHGGCTVYDHTCCSILWTVISILKKHYMVVSQNRGTPIWTLIYYNPYYGDPQKGTPNFGKLPYTVLQTAQLPSNRRCKSREGLAKST